MTTAVDRHSLRRLSSPKTWFYKRVFPACWFGFLAIFTLVLVMVAIEGDRAALFALFIPCVMGGVGYTIMRTLVWKNVDEVWDAGDRLLVGNRGESEWIPLSEVRNINWSQWQNPETLTLTLGSSTRFGNEVTFMLPSRWFPFGRNPLVTELLERIDRSRRPSTKN